MLTVVQVASVGRMVVYPGVVYWAMYPGGIPLPYTRVVHLPYTRVVHLPYTLVVHLPYTRVVYTSGCTLPYGPQGVHYPMVLRVYTSHDRPGTLCACYTSHDRPGTLCAEWCLFSLF